LKKIERGIRSLKVSTQYIHHSCYTLEIQNCFFIFDYFEGDLHLPEDKDIYFFVSHAHGDHFNNRIFDYFDRVKKNIISSDVLLSEKISSSDKVVIVEPNTDITVDEMIIKTYLSTDAGVAFMIDIFGKNIFFAGDLNDWYWEMEDSDDVRDDMHKRFVNEIDKLKNVKIDIAYFLVDPRQQGQFDLGGRQILELMPRYFLPIHFWEDYNITKKFKEKYQSLFKDTSIFDIKEKNQIFKFEI